MGKEVHNCTEGAVEQQGRDQKCKPSPHIDKDFVSKQTFCGCSTVGRLCDEPQGKGYDRKGEQYQEAWTEPVARERQRKGGKEHHGISLLAARSS